MNSNWNDFLNRKEVKKELSNINKFLKTEDYFPEKDKIFRFLEIDPYKIKIIIVGMEPYNSSFIRNGKEYPEATGRSFEVRSLSSWNQKFKQSSLRNMLKAIYKTYYNQDVTMEKLREKIINKDFPISQPKIWFDNMENQGVLFLNASLTVKKYKADTHTEIWENFMNLLIEYLNEINPDIIWCLFGNKAQERFKNKVKISLCECHPRLSQFVNTDVCFQLKDSVNFVV